MKRMQPKLSIVILNRMRTKLNRYRVELCKDSGVKLPAKVKLLNEYFLISGFPNVSETYSIF